MVIKKSELYRSLWKRCDELRGGTDVSDKYTGYKYTNIIIAEGGSFHEYTY